ncbi:tryptophan halogenase family protein [Parvularcula lutaonensis]|uniref:Tryptophan halogenase family protein n=1 Tax=Parvularcula lutaonensis TaxID=491923 RepID=A0ABV7MC21_9PROT|nr:tryptophan halogenase family protein [Parvularcula lutaonensis]GGY37895.1 tryptophan halogenase [Parvularcula lutaonensis]
MTDTVERVVIVGGGTAGWLTAGILAADHCAHEPDGLKVTLIEAPGIPILGVGEGTWPTIRDTLRRIGISETEFIRRCNASFKQGSRFDGWRDGSSSDSYFHPFGAPPNPDDCDPLALWRAAPQGEAFARAVNVQADLCLAGKAPKQAGTPEYAAVANYAYHLDAGAFSELLKEHCTDRLGVEHIEAEVVGVDLDDHGWVRAVETKERGSVSGDLFIDCSGMRSLLVGQALGAALTDVSDILFNDRALALHVPYADENAPIQSQTNGTALPAGWVWDIGLQTRRGVGHVFSSSHSTEDDARAALQQYLDRHAPGAGVSSADARLIKFRSAYRETPWVKNCVAVGMAQGFVEPLEASAIVMAELSAGMVSDSLPAHRVLMESTARRFNERFAYRWTRIVDFLKLHYIFSERREPYWQDHRNPESWTPRLVELVERWRFTPPSREDFVQIQEIFPAASYAYVLYGMGFETAPLRTRRRKDAPEIAARFLQDIHATKRKFLQGLPTNRELLNHIMAHGLSRV